jgi:8-oxo-dGTP pyrophosphatase MutT (NUDIX family)
MLRELREEIGLSSHREAERVTDFEHRPDHRRGTASLFVVRDVSYAPRWSLEVAEVGEFDLQALPDDTASITHRLLALASAQLRNRS